MYRIILQKQAYMEALQNTINKHLEELEVEKKGIEKGSLIYMDKFKQLMLYFKNDESWMSTLEKNLGGKDILRVLQTEFEMLLRLKDLFSELPAVTYEPVTDLDMAIRAAKAYTYPLGTEWGQLMPMINRFDPFIIV